MGGITRMKLLKKILIFITIFLIISSYGESLSVDKQRFVEKPNESSLLKGGHLELRDGVKILFINGTYYEMGYQHGYLLKNEIHENTRAILKRAEDVSSYEILLNIWNITRPFVPSCYIDEMQGIADGADLSFEELAVSYMFVVGIDLKCFTFAAWADATKDGRLYHIRSLDFGLVIKDPVTDKYIQENSVLIVHKPNSGLKAIIPSIAGWINFYQGINEEQVSIGVQVCWSSDQTLKAIPTMFKVQKILDSAKDADEALKILTSNTTLGWNYILSDAKTNIGYAVETTANHTYVGTWNNSVEDKYPFWEIKNVVRRTNFFIEPKLAATQRGRYNPGGLIGFIKIFSGESFFLLWRKYRAMSMEIEKNLGNIDLNSSIFLLRKVYTGKTDIFMFIFINFIKTGILCDFHQWSVCPETGDFVISFADADNNAHETQLHYFNLDELYEMDYS